MSIFVRPGYIVINASTPFFAIKNGVSFNFDRRKVAVCIRVVKKGFPVPPPSDDAALFPYVRWLFFDVWSLTL